MSVLTFAADDLFVIRVIKYLSTNPRDKWGNSYEFRATGAGDDGDLSTLASILVLFEQPLHFTEVLFDHVLVSTWAADSVPYDPSTFMSIPQSAAGTITDTSNKLGLNNCLSVARVPTSGRFGHIFYRGALQENEVTAPAGKTKIDSIPTVQARVDSALSSSELENYIGAAPETPLAMVMISASGDNVRPVTALTVLGVSQVPTDHAWFNRT